MCWRRIVVLAVTALMLNACRAAHIASERYGECPVGLWRRFGACVSRKVAEQSCGPSATSTPTGCMRKPPCEIGRARDLTTGECLAHRETRAIAATVGVLVEENTIVGCDGAFTLASGVAEKAPRLGCLPPPSAPVLDCPVGTVPLSSPGVTACTPIVGLHDVIDVVSWTRAYLAGSDSPLCTALQESPGALAVAVTTDSAIGLELSFPDNDVSQIRVEAHSSGIPNGELDHALLPMMEALRSLGGTANQAFVSLTVPCRRTSERPRTTRMTGMR